MTKKSKKQPELRFPEFTGDWEQRKFGDGMDLFTGFPFESEKFSDNGINLIRGMNVKRGYLDLSDNLCKKWKSSEGLEKYLLENEDILIQMDGALIGKSYAKIKESQLPALLVQRVTRARAIPEESNSDFMYQTIQRDFLKYIILNKTDSAVPHLSLNDIREFPIRVPNLEEQKKIGEYLSKLDNLITLHQRELDEIKKLKKGMLQKMLPKQGEKVPEIRFPEFTGDWEQRKLLDCIQKIIDFRGRTPKKLGMDWSEEGYLALSALNVKDGYIDFNQDAHYGNQELYDKWMTGNELHKGQVLFTTEAPMGNVAQVPDNRRYILSQRTIAFNVKDKIITENFLATVLRSPTIFADLTVLSSGGTAKGVSQKSLASVEIRLPKDLNEQEKIADTFYNIDNLIALHQREIDGYKELKKGLLQQMFC